MEEINKAEGLYQAIVQKNKLKQEVLSHTETVFQMFRKLASQLAKQMKDRSEVEKEEFKPYFSFENGGKHQFELRFSSDLLMFTKHSNVFEFSRNHEVMKTSYIREDKERSYCGLIHIYNFLTDSFIYHRENDLGYLIGRIFVNKEMHYFMDGKSELGLLYNNFNTSQMTEEKASEILCAAMRYASDFDLLAAPYDQVKEVSVGMFMSDLSSMKMSTGKRLGFKFQADEN